MFAKIIEKIKNKISELEEYADNSKIGFTVKGVVTYSGHDGLYEIEKVYPFLAIIDKANIELSATHITQLLESQDWNNVNIEEYSEITLSDYSKQSEGHEDWQKMINEQGAFYIIYTENGA